MPGEEDAMATSVKQMMEAANAAVRADNANAGARDDRQGQRAGGRCA